jgi:hypothetical protein
MLSVIQALVAVLSGSIIAYLALELPLLFFLLQLQKFIKHI